MRLRFSWVAAVFACAGSLLLAGCGVGGIDAIDEAFGGSGGSRPTPSAEMSASERALATEVLDLVNQERTSRGIEPVAWSEPAAAAAYAHSVDMDVRDFFDHDNPDGEGPGPRLARQGVGGQGWGENIAMGQASALTVMTAWMNSPGHRANILDPGHRFLGVGVHAAVDGPWWTQDFLR